MNVQSIGAAELFDELTTSDREVLFVSAVNFEERSETLLRLLLQRVTSRRRQIVMRPFRLVGSRPEPYSLLEIAKRDRESRLLEEARNVGQDLNIEHLVYPTNAARVSQLLDRSFARDVVLDISTMPVDVAAHLIHTALSLLSARTARAERVFLMTTPPRELVARDAAGPFEVGPLKLLRHPGALDGQQLRTHLSLLAFTGPEGFEARLAVDAVAGPNARISVLLDMGTGGLAAAHERLVGNMSILQDALEGDVGIVHHFSQFDAMQVALDMAKRSAELCAESPTLRHGLLVAPFWPPYAVAVGCLALAQFENLAGQLLPSTSYFSDLIFLSRHQYVSPFSIGHGSPEGFVVCGPLP